MGDNIKVSVRLRNLIDKEIQSKAVIHWEAKDKTTVGLVNSTSSSYSYDRVFAGNENNEAVYTEFCAPIVESVISGFNGTIFAYGQTSSGKTYTLIGGDRFDLGIAHLTVCDLFKHIQNMEEREFLLRVSLMEIYNNEKVIDLLAKKSEENLKLQDDQYGNVKVLNLTETEVQEPEQVLELLRKGQRRRKTGETVLNQKSSRSHLLFRMIIESRLRGNENAAVNVSHFNIVDLAGSEKPSENAGARFKEGVNINTSLLMLSQVINQLSAEKESQFINYRASKLTRILKNSLGGNALTSIICTITPASYEETLSTLKFALSAKKIKNKPHVNEVETEETLIKSYANKIKKLTKQLEATKEEKDMEAKKRRDMQEQIEGLKKKFVQFVPQNDNIPRNTRRETWGGCLDLARMKNLFQPSRPFQLSSVDEESELTLDALEIDRTNNGDLFRNRMSLVSSRCSVETIFEECSKKEDVSVQTDLFQNDNLGSELNAEKKKKYEERIAELERELCDLNNFTTLEKQMFFDEQSETKVMKKSSTGSLFSPYLEKSEINNLSLCEESFGIINNLIDRKSEICRNVIDLDQEMFLKNLNNIIDKLGNMLNIEALSPAIVHPYFKAIYQLAYMIFQTHFTGNQISLDEQVKEMFTLLTKIFVGFSNQGDSDEQNSELIYHFGELSEKLLKDMEKVSVNSKHSSDADNCFKNEKAACEIPNESCSNSSDVHQPLSCQCKYQIPLLEDSINTHLDTINSLQNNHELLKKQIHLSEDKVKIQEQVIASLEKEMELKVKCCVGMADNFTQTSYMELLTNDCPSLPKEISSSNDYSSKTGRPNCSKLLDSSTDQNVPDPALSMIKSELHDLLLHTQRIMEDCMPKAYFEDVTANETTETSDTALVDSLKTEIAAMKNRLHKIKFFLKDRSELSEHLKNEMVDKMVEISSLQRQCSSTEKEWRENEDQFNQLKADLGRFRKEISRRRLSVNALNVDVKCLEDTKPIDDLTYLKRVVKSFEDVIIESHSKLKELRQQHTSKQSKVTQTVENYPDLAALEEVRAHEYKEREHLCQENTSLKLNMEEFIQKVENLEQELKLKENNISEIKKSHEEELEKNLSHLKETENKWKETLKNIEDKYEEELKVQEKSLFDMMYEKLKSLREEYNSEQEKKLEKLQAQYEKVISQLTSKCETLKSDLGSKLNEAINNHEDSKLKLEAEIRDFKKREENATKAYYKMKDKFKEYVKGVQNMRMNNAKCVKEKETQTNYENTFASSCNECRTLKLEQKELKTQTALKNSEIASLEVNNKNMMREIAALKKDIAAKSALLFSCNCRLYPKPQNILCEASQKTKVSNAPIDQEKNAVNPKEILKLDIVQKAINEARESERAIFNNGEGPASQEMCLLLRRKLAKKDKEINELRNIVSRAQLKVAPIKKPLEKLNDENVPNLPVDARVLDSFTPAIKTVNNQADDAVLKIHPKKILHELPQNVVAPKNEYFITEEESAMAKELEENQRKYNSGELCKTQ